MNLRVYRTYKWVPTPGHPIRLGGENPMSLVHSDELQVEIEGEWVPVPVVEAPKPEHPAEARRRVQQAQHQASMQEMMQNVRVLQPGEPFFAAQDGRDSAT